MGDSFGAEYRAPLALHLPNRALEPGEWERIAALGCTDYVDLHPFRSRWGWIRERQPGARIHARIESRGALDDPIGEARDTAALVAEVGAHVASWRRRNEPDQETPGTTPESWAAWLRAYFGELRRLGVGGRHAIPPIGDPTGPRWGALTVAGIAVARELGIEDVDAHLYGWSGEVAAQYTALRRLWGGAVLVTETNFGAGRTVALEQYAGQLGEVVGALAGVELRALFIWDWERPDIPLPVSVAVRGSPIEGAAAAINRRAAKGSTDATSPGHNTSVISAPISPARAEGGKMGTRAIRVALASGHHNSGGGDAVEHALMHRLTPAVAAALRRGGAEVRVVDADESGHDHDLALGDVAAQVARWHRAGWMPDLFLELHSNAGPRGSFAVYPDWPIGGGRDLDTDVRDVLGPAIAAALAAATGIPVYRGGVMGERSTHVGSQGSRLGVFGGTVGLRASCTRLIYEVGAHSQPEDLAIMRRADWPGRAAAAIATAILTWWDPEAKPVAVAPIAVEKPTPRAKVGPGLRNWIKANPDAGAPLGDSWHDRHGNEAVQLGTSKRYPSGAMIIARKWLNWRIGVASWD